MNKKQVGAFLKVMSKDVSREALMGAMLVMYDGFTSLVATDSHVLASVRLDNDADELIGTFIRRDALERWYKLADGKSRLTGSELVRVSQDDYANHGSYQNTPFPNWESLVPMHEPEEGLTEIAFNADYMKLIQDLDGEGKIRLKLYGKLKPMVFESDRGTYLIMPMK